MISSFEKYKMLVEFLPFFFETDYNSSPIHSKNEAFLKKVENNTLKNIEDANVRLLEHIREFAAWYSSAYYALSRVNRPEVPVVPPPELENWFRDLKKMLLNLNLPASELQKPDGAFQQTLEKIKSFSYAEPFRIPLEETAWHVEEMEKFHAEFRVRFNRLQALIQIRDLTADMGDYAVKMFEEHIQNGNRRAVCYWRDKKMQWLDELDSCGKQYFDALKSLPLALSEDEEKRLLEIIDDPSGPYYNDGDREAHHAAKKEAGELLSKLNEECLEFPVARVNAVYTPPKSGAVKFSLPICFHRREALWLGGNAETQREALHLLFDTLICQFMRNTTAGEMEIAVLDPVFNGDFMTKFQKYLSRENSGGRKAVAITVNASRDPNSLKDFLKKYAEENVVRTIQMLGDAYEYVEDFNHVNRTLPIPRKMLLVNALDTFVKPGSTSSEQDLQNLAFIVKNAAKCGIFVVISGSTDCFMALKKESGIADRIKFMALHPTEIGTVATPISEIVEFEHPGFKVTSGLRVMETTSEEIRRLCLGLREIAASIDLSVALADILPEGSLFSAAAYNRLRVPFGKNSRGETAYWFCDKDVAGHTLIVGGTGSGKSNLIHCLITSACYLHRPDEFQVFLVDLKKGVEFKRYADSGLPHARVVAVEGDPEMALGVLENVYKLYEKHSELMKKYGVVNLESLWANGGRAPRIALIIDEFQMLFENETTKAAAAQYLEKLIKEGRAAGVNVILATQNPANVPSGIKDNVTTRIVMRNQRTIFTEAAGFQNKDFCDQVVMPGDFLLLESGSTVLGRCALINTEQQEKMLAEISGRVKADPEIRLDFESLIYDGAHFPSGENAVFQRMLRKAAAQKNATFVLGEDKSLSRCVYCSLAEEAGENILIAGDHGGQTDLNEDWDEEEGVAAKEIFCSQALYWTLAQSLNPMLVGGKASLAIYDRKEYLLPYLTKNASFKNLATPQALAQEIFDLYDLVKARDGGAPSAERKILAVMNAQTLYPLKELRNDAAPTAPTMPAFTSRPAPSAVSPGKSGSLLAGLSAPAKISATPAFTPPSTRSTGSANLTAAAALQHVLQYGPQYNIYVIMSSGNLGILLRDVMERMTNLKNLFHHIICMQMSEDDLSVQLGVRSLRRTDMGPRHAFYVNEIASPQPRRFRPYFDTNL